MRYWYRYRDDLWKLVEVNDYDKNGKFCPRKPETVDRLKSNIRRAVRTIEGYALCNDWEWFGTFTLSPELRDRHDLDGFRRDFMRMIRDGRRKWGNTQALLVPEPHKRDGAWHMHGLISGLPMDALRPFQLTENLPRYLMDKLMQGFDIYDWPYYRQHFGWVDIEPIRNRDAAGRYITKYLTKGADGTASALDVGKHLYYVTRGLKQPERMEREGDPEGLVLGNRYEFDYGSVQWYQAPPKK